MRDVRFNFLFLEQFLISKQIFLAHPKPRQPAQRVDVVRPGFLGRNPVKITRAGQFGIRFFLIASNYRESV